MATATTVTDWPRAHGRPVCRGRIRSTTADFFVSESLGFRPDGLGEHDFLWIEKRDTNTEWLARRLAEYAGVAPRDVGFAGMKDRHALTRQWFSVRRCGGGRDWTGFSVDGSTILECTRNSRKLRRGAHRGNAFRLRVVDLAGDEEMLAERLRLVAARGVPNYFGEQRFGRDAHNLQLANRLFSGGRLPRARRGIALSAARAWLFNHLLATRVLDASWNTVREGDAVQLDGRGSLFRATPDDELEQRLARLELHPTAALWGRADSDYDVNRPRNVRAISRTERELAAAYPELRDGLEAHLEADRRATRLSVADLRWTISHNELQLEFRLAKGGYATAVLRELVDYCEPPGPHQGRSRSSRT